MTRPWVQTHDLPHKRPVLYRFGHRTRCGYKKGLGSLASLCWRLTSSVHPPLVGLRWFAGSGSVAWRCRSRTAHSFRCPPSGCSQSAAAGAGGVKTQSHQAPAQLNLFTNIMIAGMKVVCRNKAEVTPMANFSESAHIIPLSGNHGEYAVSQVSTNLVVTLSAPMPSSFLFAFYALLHQRSYNHPTVVIYTSRFHGILFNIYS